MVQSDGLVAATERFNNGNNESRTYDVSSTIEYTADGNVTAIKSGVARTIGDTPVTVANFARWDHGKLTVNFENVTDANEMASIFSDITSYITGVETKIANDAQASL